MTGIALTDGTLTDVTIKGCRLDLASFTGSRLIRVTFEDCLLRQTDVMGADALTPHDGPEVTTAPLLRASWASIVPRSSFTR